MKLKIDLTQGNKNVYFISDFHFFHENVIRFDKRPFSNVHEMHNEIVKCWNETVTKNDIVIYLGDLSFAKKKDENNVLDIINKLNGEIHFVLGNHDRIQDIKKTNRFSTIQDYLELKLLHFDDDSKVIETMFCCMHYPIYAWNKSHFGSILVHGHCHMNFFNEDKKWISEMDTFSKFIPKEELEKYYTLIKQKNYYSRRVFDVGCMGLDYKPISYLDILKIGENRLFSNHH